MPQSRTVAALVLLFAAGALGQTPEPATAANPAPPPTDKRVMGILPNYRTAEMSAASTPLTSSEKIHIAVKDTFDYPLLGVSAFLAGIYHLEDNHPQFGQGAEGYFKRLGTSYTDQLVGNFLTEGVLPVAFHEDPRYFRMSTGTTSHRLFYAMSRTVITRTDAGGYSPNFAELVGNGIAAGVGLSYYSDDRSASQYVRNWGVQLLTDTGSQVLKEFWPDIKRRWFAGRRQHSEPILAAAAH